MPKTTVLEPVYEEIGRRVELLRLERRLSQRDLGQRLRHPLTRAAISNIELGRQRLLAHVLLEIAAVLRVAPAEFLPEMTEPDAAAVDTLRPQLDALNLGGATVSALLAAVAGGKP